MPRRLLVFGALVVALAVGVALLLRHSHAARTTSAVTGTTGPTTPEPARPRPILQGFPVRLGDPGEGALGSSAPNGAFEGRVVSAATGRGLPGAQLTFGRAGETSDIAGGFDGTFHFVPRVPGRWLLAAVTAPGHLPFAPEWGQSPVQLDARPGEIVRGITITLMPAEEYAGLVVDERDQPVAGAVVRVLGGGAGASSLVPLRDRFESDAAGKFRFTAPDNAVLEARHGKFATGRARVDFAARASRKVVIRLRPAGDNPLTIEGRVDDFSESPVEGAVVSAVHKDNRADAPATVRTDAQGRFRLEDLAAGTWLLMASQPGTAPAFAEAVAGARGVHLRLGPGGRLVGHVRDSRSGKPISAFTVLLEAKERRSASSIDRTGSYEMDDLPPGPATVRAVARGYAPSPELRVTIPEPGAPPVTADFDLHAGGRLVGVVLERGTKKPIAGAHLEAEGAPDPQVVPVRSDAVTDADGHFELVGLGENTTGVFAWAPGHHARILSGFRIPEGETYGPVTIELSALEPGEEPGIELAGIGTVLEKAGDVLRIGAVAPTGGAAEVGLGPGDAILAIDGVPVGPMTLAEAVPLIRGPEGSTVVLAVMKAGQQQIVTLVVPRRLVRN